MYQKYKLVVSINLLSLELLIISLLVSSVNAVDPRQYDDCAPTESSCGFEWKIAYPFWDSRKPDYCGHPAFELRCVNDTALTISIEKQTYNILNINYETKAFTISKPQFSVNACPPLEEMTNTSLNLDLLSYGATSQNSTLFYDCISTPLLGVNAPYAFDCALISSYSNPEQANTLSYMALNQTWVQKLQKSCSFEVTVPILKSSAEALADGGTTIVDALSKGFEVNWKVDDDDQCKDCMNSGGRCGYNQTLDGPVCFCKQGVYDRICGQASHHDDMSLTNVQGLPPAHKDSNKFAIALVVGIVGCVVLSCLMCFCLYRRHRKKNSAVHFLSHDKSYDLSSGGSSTQFLTGSTYFGVHVFNYRELEVATEYFNPSRELGEGGFGTVYYGKLQDGREVAIKRLYENNSKRAEQFLNEVEILANLRHKNLVNLYGCTSRQSRELLLVYEYVPNGTVADHLHGRQSKVSPLPWSTRLSIATQTASALVYLHDSDIIHRDVKTQNVLLDNDFTVKVADFGLSRLFPLDVTHVSTAPQGTPGYVDPEYHQCYQLTEKSDVYSFGVMLAELISSLPAVDITRKRNEINLATLAINKIHNYALHEFVDSSLGFESDFKVKKEIIAVAELCFQCLQSTKEMRPTMIELLKRLLVIQGQQGSEMDRAEVVDIPADDVLMLKGDFSPPSPPREDTFATRYKPNASA